MFENSTAKTRKQFLRVWSILNIAGWFLGICLVFLVDLNVEYTAKFSALRTFLIWLPLGASVSVFQWYKLKQLGINPIAWVVITTLGFSTFFTLHAWVLNFNSFDYRQYNIPAWIINLGEVLTTLVSAVMIGGSQSSLIRKHISGAWVMAYVLAAFMAFAVLALGFAIKSVLLETLYFLGLYFIAFGPVKYILLFALTVLVASITISLVTGKVLLKQLSSDAIPRTG